MGRILLRHIVRTKLPHSRRRAMRNSLCHPRWNRRTEMIVVLELELVPDRVVAIAGVLSEGDVPRYDPDVTSVGRD